MRDEWSAEVSLLVVVLGTMHRVLALEILILSSHRVCRAIGIYAFLSSSPLWVSRGEL
jgi:hypothetical protein